MKKVIFAIHGLGGRGSWFGNLIKYLETYDVEVINPDLPGFGTNNQEHNAQAICPQGHVNHYNVWLNFCNKTYQNLKKEKPDAEIVVLGHSLGAVIACNLDLDTNDKLILSVPGFKGAQETFSLSYTFKVMFKLALDKLTGKISKVELPSSQESGHITDNDPYKVTKVSPNLLFQILRLNERTREQVAFLQNPLLVLKIAGDRVVDNETIDAYFEVMPSVFKQKITSDYQDHDWIWVPEAVNEIAPEILNFARTRIAKP